MQLRAAAEDTGLEVRLEASGYVKSSAPVSDQNTVHHEGMYISPFDTGIPGLRVVNYTRSTGGVLRSAAEQPCLEPGVAPPVPKDIQALRSAKQTIILHTNWVGHVAACSLLTKLL
jgi:hypothetical protein